MALASPSRPQRDEKARLNDLSPKLNQWVKNVTLLREIAQDMLSGAVTTQDFKAKLVGDYAMLRNKVGGRAELYEALGHGQSLKGIEVSSGSYSMRGGVIYNPAKTLWTVERKANGGTFGNWPRELAVADTRQGAIDQFVAKVQGGEKLAEDAKGTQFVIWRDSGKYHVGKKIGKDYASLKKFDDVAAARKYKAENQAELDAALVRYKDTPFERRTENLPRVGEDHRGGAKVTPEAFADAFGFRGIQFGNYVEQSKRQADLNDAYDALMDLAAVIGVPPRALSLGGQLGLAFGARGKGGINAAAAHYEPGAVVINLTKNSGAGSLAHELLHAMDNYFANLGGGKGGMMTLGASNPNVRGEMVAAFKRVTAATQQPGMKARSKELDKRRSKAYWSTSDEMAARSFEAYVIAKLRDQGAANDYLANIVSPEVWDASEALLGHGDEKTYPYPTQEEMGTIRESFDGFFDAVQTRTDDAGNVAMFSRRTGSPVEMSAVAIGAKLSAATEHPKYAAAKSGDQAAALDLARDLVSDDFVAAVRALIGDASPIIQPVNSQEAAGRNKVPLAVASVLAQRLGLSVGSDILQSNRPQRTDMDGLDRLFAVPEFDGSVAPGAAYLMVDDTLTQGGTFAALASHITQNGGTVLGAAALTGKSYSATMALSPELLGQVRERFSNVEQAFRSVTGYGFDALTQSEARYLASHRAPESIRDRILAQRDAAQQRLDEQGTGQELDGAFSRKGAGRGVPIRDAEAVAAMIREANPTGPQIVVLDDVEKAPDALLTEIHKAGAANDVDGAYFEGTIYLFPQHVSSIERLMFVGAHHEIRHAGLDALFGKRKGVLMLAIGQTNPAVMAAAKQKIADGHATSMVKAVEEALADMPVEELVKLNGWDRMVAAVRSWLRDMAALLKRNHAELSDMIEPKEWTDKDVAALIRRAENISRGGTVPARSGAAMFSQASEVADNELANTDTRFSRATMADALTARVDQIKGLNQQKVRDAFADMIGSAGAKVSWWDKTLGTQYAKAEKIPAYKRVFERVQSYIADVSTLANEAADQAPAILPKLETWKDLRQSFKQYGMSKADTEALAGPVFQGTLSWARDKNGQPVEESDPTKAGIVWADAELTERFKLNTDQIKSYRQFLAATNVSLDQVVAADVLKLLGDKNPALREIALADRQAMRAGIDEYLTQQIDKAGDGKASADLLALRTDIRAKYARIDQLKARGYAPLMRFGKYKVYVSDPGTGDSLFFGLYETKTEANRMARDLAEDPEFKGKTVEQGVLSAEQHKLFSALPVESLEMFAGAIGAEKSEVFQAYLRLAKNNRSALKRLIHRKGTAGYAEDIPRVLASFVTSNARLSAAALNLAGAKAEIEGIRDGDVKDEAINLVESVQNPVETAAGARALMFMNFIGGSIASAVVNLTQPITMTLPYLSQFGGFTKAGARLMAAGKMAASGKIDSAELQKALKRAVMGKPPYAITSCVASVPSPRHCRTHRAAGPSPATLPAMRSARRASCPRVPAAATAWSRAAPTSAPVSS